MDEETFDSIYPEETYNARRTDKSYYKDNKGVMHLKID